MNKLSIVEKAKRYDEAIEKLRSLHDNYDAVSTLIDVKEELENIFPELAESEGEMICRKLIAFLKQCKAVYGDGFKQFGLNIEDALAWLEKKCEQKHQYNSRPRYIGEEELLGEQKLADKVEPKFHKGDWVILTDGELSTTLQIVKVDTNKRLYWFNDSSYLPIVDEECLRLWTIQDAKDGDVLSDGENIILFRNIGNGKWNDIVDYYCGCVKSRGNDVFDMQEDDQYWCCIKDCILLPATKEQHDLLFAKMKEAGYEWDADKKELRKIEQKPWSEEDETRLTNIIIMLKEGASHHFIKDDITKAVNWLKSLKDRVQPQPKQEWSEEDEKHIHSIISTIECCKAQYKEAIAVIEQYDLDIEWLKSLKVRVLPQPKQEWSDEDKKLIDDTCHLINTLASGYGEKVTEPITFSGTQMIASIKDRLRALVDNRPQSHWKPSEGQMAALKCAITTADEKWVCMNTKDLESLYEDLKKLKD